jgi:hypothetical protein
MQNEMSVEAVSERRGVALRDRLLTELSYSDSIFNQKKGAIRRPLLWAELRFRVIEDSLAVEPS